MWNGANYELMAPTVNPTSILSGQCYLIPSSSTQIILSPYNGNRVPVQGSLVSIPAAGRAVANTSVTINGTPGGNLAANTDYLVSLNVGGTLEFWTLGTGYSFSNTAGNVGVVVISGHDDKTLVGMIGTDGAGQFVTALVLSWFNQKPKSNRTNFTGDQTTASTTPVELSTTIRNTFLTWSNTQVRFSNTGTVQANSSGQRAVTGIGFDGITPEQEAAIYSGMHTSTEGSSVWGTSNFSGTKLLSDGRHYATLLGTATDSAGGGLLATWTGGTSVFTGLVSAPNALTIQVQG
jgi:hypothetical protein